MKKAMEEEVVHFLDYIRPVWCFVPKNKQIWLMGGGGGSDGLMGGGGVRSDGLMWGGGSD